MNASNVMSLSLVKQASWRYHADRITAAWGDAVESIIRTGEYLIEAKNDPEMKHGSFETMIQQKLPFTPSTARRLMKVAGDPVLSKRAHAHALPPSWVTLYELSKLDGATLLTAIKDGTITPKMERKDVALLRKKFGSKPTNRPKQRTQREIVLEVVGTLGRATGQAIADYCRQHTAVKKPSSPSARLVELRREGIIGTSFNSDGVLEFYLTTDKDQVPAFERDAEIAVDDAAEKVAQLSDKAQVAYARRFLKRLGLSQVLEPQTAATLPKLEWDADPAHDFGKRYPAFRAGEYWVNAAADIYDNVNYAVYCGPEATMPDRRVVGRAKTANEAKRIAQRDFDNRNRNRLIGPAR